MIGIPSMLLLASLATASTPVATKVHLTFAPVEGREIVQHLATHTVTRIVGDTLKREATQESVTRIRWQRSGSEWRLVATMESGRQTRDGVEVPDPFLAGLLGHQVVYRLDDEAKVLGLEGYEAIVGALKSSLPENLRSVYAPLLDVEALQRKDQHEFEARVTEWVGAEVEDGLQLEYTDTYPLPTGPITFHTRTRVGPIETRDGGTRVTIRSVYSSDSTGLGGMIEHWAKALSQPGLMDSLRVGSPALSGTIERVLDAATMDILGEHAVRVLRTRATLPGRGDVDVERTEDRTWRFEIRPSGKR